MVHQLEVIGAAFPAAGRPSLIPPNLSFLRALRFQTQTTLAHRRGGVGGGIALS